MGVRRLFSRGGGKNILFALKMPKNTLFSFKKVKNILFWLAKCVCVWGGKFLMQRLLNCRLKILNHLLLTFITLVIDTGLDNQVKKFLSNISTTKKLNILVFDITTLSLDFFCLFMEFRFSRNFHIISFYRSSHPQKWYIINSINCNAISKPTAITLVSSILPSVKHSLQNYYCIF